MVQALKRTVDRLRQLASTPASTAGQGERSDRQLLETFAKTGEESAFALVVRRHGALVLGVCRRVLGNVDDAEDAFQATFLVLARKAGQVPWHDSIRNWLHGVAYRIACKARAGRARRLRKEREAGQASTATALESAWAELRGVLDEELDRLPAKYRVPLLLCCLEGKTREEAADELGWSVGSVKGRLERGRDLLRERLGNRGLTLPAVLCTGLLAESSVSATLAEAALRAAVPFAAGNGAAATASPIVVHLAQGALHAMLIAKCKITGLVLTLTCALGLGGSLAVREVWADRPAASPGAAVSAPLVSLDMSVLDPEPILFQEKERPREGDAKQEKERPRDGDRKPEKERPRDGERERVVPGIVKNIDVKAGTITIQGPRDGEAGEQTLNLAGKDVKVTSNVERPMTLAEVREGLRVLLVLNENKDVQGIRVAFPLVGAQIVSVDAAKRSITIRMERTGETTLKVADDAKIRVGERALELAAVDAGQFAQMFLSPDRQTVWVIFLGARRGEQPRPGADRGPAGRERDGRLGGVLVEIDAAKGTVGILIGREGDLRIATLTLAKDAKLRLLSGDRPIGDLTAGQLVKAVQVWATLGEDQKSATGLDVMAPTMRLRVKAVDAAGRKITVGAEAREHTFELAADAKIIRGRGEVQLNELAPGMAVMLSLSLDRSKVLAATVIGDGERER